MLDRSARLRPRTWSSRWALSWGRRTTRSRQRCLWWPALRRRSLGWATWSCPGPLLWPPTRNVRPTPPSVVACGFTWPPRPLACLASGISGGWDSFALRRPRGVQLCLGIVYPSRPPSRRQPVVGLSRFPPHVHRVLDRLFGLPHSLPELWPETWPGEELPPADAGTASDSDGAAECLGDEESSSDSSRPTSPCSSSSEAAHP